MDVPKDALVYDNGQTTAGVRTLTLYTTDTRAVYYYYDAWGDGLNEDDYGNPINGNWKMLCDWTTSRSISVNLWNYRDYETLGFRIRCKPDSTSYDWSEWTYSDYVINPVNEIRCTFNVAERGGNYVTFNVTFAKHTSKVIISLGDNVSGHSVTFNSEGNGSLTNLEEGKKYTVYIDSYGETTTFSKVSAKYQDTFDVETKTTPKLTTPQYANQYNLNSSGVTVEFTDDPNATYTMVWVYRQKGSSPYLSSDHNDPKNDSQVAAYTLTSVNAKAIDGLYSNTKYWWWMQSYASTYQTSDMSGKYTFQTLQSTVPVDDTPGAPTISLASKTWNSITVNISWGNYSSMGWVKCSGGNDHYLNSIVSSYQITGLSQTTSYTIYVYALNDSGERGGDSNYISVTTNVDNTVPQPPSVAVQLYQSQVNRATLSITRGINTAYTQVSLYHTVNGQQVSVLFDETGYENKTWEYTNLVNGDVYRWAAIGLTESRVMTAESYKTFQAGFFGTIGEPTVTYKFLSLDSVQFTAIPGANGSMVDWFFYDNGSLLQNIQFNGYQPVYYLTNGHTYSWSCHTHASIGSAYSSDVTGSFVADTIPKPLPNSFWNVYRGDPFVIKADDYNYFKRYMASIFRYQGRTPSDYTTGGFVNPNSTVITYGYMNELVYAMRTLMNRSDIPVLAQQGQPITADWLRGLKVTLNNYVNSL